MRRRPAGAILAVIAALLLGAGGARAALWTDPEERLSTSAFLSLTASSRPTLARLPDGSLYAVWYERTGVRSSRVIGRRRDPAGQWDPIPEVISNGDSLARAPVLAAGLDGELHVAWEDLRSGTEEIFYRRRAPTGEWGGEEPVTGEAAPSREPVLAVGPTGRLYLVWSDGIDGNFEIYDCWRDPGSGFSPPRRLTDHPGESTSPNAAVNQNGDLHLVWQDAVLVGTPGDQLNTEVYYERLDADGRPTGPPVRVSLALGISKSPTLSLARDGSLHVVWSDNRDTAPGSNGYFPFAIWYRRWIPGLGFGHEKRFAYSAADHLNPCVATTPDGSINVAWEDYAVGNADIYFRQIRTATGWDVTPTRLTFSNGPTRGPGLLGDPDGRLHLVWADAGVGEELSIRYRSGQADPTVPVVLHDGHLQRLDDRVVIRWSATDDGEAAGFRLYGAAAPDEESRPLTAILTGGPEYDVTLAGGDLLGVGVIRLVAIHRDGRSETLALFPLADGSFPRPGSPPALLGPPSPNPARGALTLPVTLAGSGDVELELFDLAGRRLSRRGPVRLEPGDHRLGWSPGREGGEELVPGRYWIRALLNGRPMPGARSILIVP